MPPAKTTRQQKPLSQEELLNAALHQVGRDQMGGRLLGKGILIRQSVLTIKLLREVRDHYVTLPQPIRAALQEFIYGR